MCRIGVGCVGVGSDTCVGLVSDVSGGVGSDTFVSDWCRIGVGLVSDWCRIGVGLVSDVSGGVG